MRSAQLRMLLIAVLVVAAVVSVVGNKEHSRLLGGLTFVVFLGAVLVYVRWRRAALEERRAARVFDREAKTDEARARPDQ